MSWGVPDGVVVSFVEEREERRVSWRPGTEGAPLAVLEEVFVAEVEWDDGGAILRDWGGIISGLCDRESRSGADHLCSLMEAVIRELDVGT